MSSLSEPGNLPFSFLITKGPGYISHEVVTIKAGTGKLKAGAVLGEVIGPIIVGAATFSGSGNGTFTPARPAYGAGVQSGLYRVRLIEAGANTGSFEVIRPDDTIDGFAVVGTAYDGQIKFTIADGTTDFSNEAQFAVPVSIGPGSFKPSPHVGTDGSEIAKAVLGSSVDASDHDVNATVIRRRAEVKEAMLVFDPSVDDAAKIAAKIAQLAAQSITAR